MPVTHGQEASIPSIEYSLRADLVVAFILVGVLLIILSSRIAQ